MGGCSHCGRSSAVTVTGGSEVKYTKVVDNDIKNPGVVPASENDKLVKLRYYGGGMTKRVSTGCSTCHGGKTSYSVTTSETIMFVSDDAPNGLYKETVTAGHNYYVTRNQADYMLKLTYKDAAGRTQPKFKEIKE